MNDALQACEKGGARYTEENGKDEKKIGGFIDSLLVNCSVFYRKTRIALPFR
jgi:hypothetical protein